MREVANTAHYKTSLNQHLTNSFVFHLENIHVKFNTIEALRNISLTINPGEIIFITGKSGAGKSTLLNVLAEDIFPTKGRLRVGARVQFVAQVFQESKLFDLQTVEQNLWYSYDSTIYKSKANFKHDLNELVGVMGIRPKMNIKMSNANGGLKQKVAIIRALLTRPTVLLADEPTSSMDKESAIKVFDVLKYYNSKRKLTIIWASHNRDLVKEFPGKIIHLEQGKLVYSGHACFI